MAQRQTKDQVVTDSPLYVQMTTGSLKSHQWPDDPTMQKGIAETSMGSMAASASIRTRPGHSREDLYNYRDEERMPTKYVDIVTACQSLYRRNGLVRNAVDMMSDFAGDGLGVQHSSGAQANFYRAWLRAVHIQSRSNDFMRMVLRDGNVVVYRSMGRVQVKNRTKFAKLLKKGGLSMGLRAKDLLLPMEYTFLPPQLVRRLGPGEDTVYGGRARFGLIVNATMRTEVKSRLNSQDVSGQGLPAELLRAVNDTKVNIVPLDPDRVFVGHYKKDDWQDWAIPFLYGVLEDVLFKDKMRQADMAALDGVINVIRLWKLGKADKKILPTVTAANKLLSILGRNTGGGCMDIVWDDMIDLKVEYPPVDKILGDAKYKPINQDILKGLGIPEILMGGSGGEGGARGAAPVFAQLKTIIERLKYVRGVCLEWLQGELAAVASAMGFRSVPRTIFAQMNLGDEVAEKKLLIGLLDRGLISIESIHENFGRDFVIELERLRAEEAIRKESPPVLEKADPYHRAFSVMDRQFEQQKALQEMKNRVEPGGGDGGGDNPAGDQPRNDQQGTPPGRPEASPLLPSLALRSLALSYWKVIESFWSARMTATAKRMTKARRAEVELCKWATLCSITPTSGCDEDVIKRALSSPKNNVISQIFVIYSDLTNRFMNASGKSPTRCEVVDLKVSAWAIYYAGRGML